MDGKFQFIEQTQPRGLERGQAGHETGFGIGRLGGLRKDTPFADNADLHPRAAEIAGEDGHAREFVLVSLHICSICSSVRPLVSGTSISTKINESRLTPA